MPHRLADAETLQATRADFRPAVSVTMDGGITALLGYLGGGAVVVAGRALPAAADGLSAPLAPGPKSG